MAGIDAPVDTPRRFHAATTKRHMIPPIRPVLQSMPNPHVLQVEVRRVDPGHREPILRPGAPAALQLQLHLVDGPFDRPAPCVPINRGFQAGLKVLPHRGLVREHHNHAGEDDEHDEGDDETKEPRLTLPPVTGVVEAQVEE